ncbi:putative non-specific serine/threonine protein kinase [Helianthus debilis subsp. tardiflorus]
MRPKISDIGLARMFQEDKSEANTKRVVGTLGYISPEYAVNGLFSAGRLHKEGKSLDLIDECLGSSYSACEVLRSVHVGLLCVQQRVEDRPNTRTVVGMLDGEGSLPSPKKPAFFLHQSETSSTSALPLLSPSSVNSVTLSQVDGR